MENDEKLQEMLQSQTPIYKWMVAYHEEHARHALFIAAQTCQRLSDYVCEMLCFAFEEEGNRIK